MLRSDPASGSYVLLDTLRHPEGRVRGRERIGPLVHRDFARRVAEHLDDGWVHGDFEGVTLVAAPWFLEELTRQLSGSVRQRRSGREFNTPSPEQGASTRALSNPDTSAGSSS